MKNIEIKVKWLKREAIIILICYLIANLLNVIAIAVYGTAWDEILSKQIIVLFIAEIAIFIDDKTGPSPSCSSFENS